MISQFHSFLTVERKNYTGEDSIEILEYILSWSIERNLK